MNMGLWGPHIFLGYVAVVSFFPIFEMKYYLLNVLFIFFVSAQDKLKIPTKKDIYIDTTYPADTSGYYRKNPCSFTVQSPYSGDRVMVQVVKNLNPSSGCIRRWDERDSLFECVASGVDSAPSAYDSLDAFCNSNVWRITPNAFNLFAMEDAGDIVDNTNNARFTVKLSSEKNPSVNMNLSISVIFRMHSRNSTWFPLLGSYTGIYRSVMCRNGARVVSVASSIRGKGSWTYFHGFKFVCSDGQVLTFSGSGTNATNQFSDELTRCIYIKGLSVKQSKDRFGAYYQSYPPNALSFTCQDYNNKISKGDWKGFSTDADVESIQTCPKNQGISGFQGYISPDDDRINGLNPICKVLDFSEIDLISGRTATIIIFVFFGTGSILGIIVSRVFRKKYETTYGDQDEKVNLKSSLALKSLQLES